jgi:hypothetical protein
VHIFADFADYPFATSDLAGRNNGRLAANRRKRGCGTREFGKPFAPKRPSSLIQPLTFELVRKKCFARH